eukprot:gene27363-14491_t
MVGPATPFSFLTTKSSEDSKSGQVVEVRPATPGLVAGQINLRGWASTKSRPAVPEKSQVHSCIIRLLNGVLGQRGQLINEVSSEAVAVRLTGFVLDFS